MSAMDGVHNVSVDDVLIDALSFKHHAGGSYVTDRRSVRYFSMGSNVYKPSGGNRVLKFQLASGNNGWLDPQSVMVFFTVQNLDKSNNKKLRFISGNPACLFRRVRVLMGNT